MESELTHTQGHRYESSDLSAYPAGLPSGGEGNSEGHQEKPSMMKRVKAKAKKIKNRLTGQGHDHDHDQSRGQEECEEDEDEEEMAEDPEIHGAPISDAVADKVATRASDGQSATGGTKLDSPAMVSPHYNSPIVNPETRPFVQWQADEDQGKHLLNEDKHVTFPSKLVDTRSGEDINPELPHKGIDTRTVRDVYEERENADQVGGPNAMEEIRGIGTTGIEVDPQGPDLRVHPSDVQIKTIYPPSRGSEEEVAEGITPVIKSFNELGITEEKTKSEQGKGGGLYTGSHNQFSPEPVPSESSHSISESYDGAKPRDMPSFESSDFVSKSYNAANPRDMPSFESTDSVNPRDMPSFESSDSVNPRDIPTFESSDSRDMPSFESSDSVPKSHDAANSRDMPTSESSDSVPKSHDAATHQDMTSSESSESVPKSYNAADPQDMPEDVYDPTSQSSTYTEKITSASVAAASAIAGTAQSAKNAIASKIGQTHEPGEVSEPRSVMETEPGEGNKPGSVMGTASDYAYKMAATVTSTLAPVYGKVVGGGTGATSKVSELGAETTQESSESVGRDKDVSVKEYSVEKLNPDEEYKPLSAIMIESLEESKEEKMEEVPSGGGEGHDVSQIASDVVHKREPEESEEEKPMGVEKLNPDEEYKPLSAIMIESLEESKEEKMEEVPSGGGEGHDVSQIASDVVHKREPEESEEEKPLGKVTDSEEVAKRLGTEEEGSGLGNAGTGASMVSKLTGAIGSWLGGQGGAANSTPVKTLADDNEGDMGKNADAHVVPGEKRLQE